MFSPCAQRIQSFYLLRYGIFLYVLTPEIFSVTPFGLRKTGTINSQCRQSCLQDWGCQAPKINQKEHPDLFSTFESFRFQIALSLIDPSDWPHTWMELCQRNCYCGSQATTFCMLTVKYNILTFLLLQLRGHQGLIAKPSQLRWFFPLTSETFNSNPNLLIQTTHMTPALQEIELIRKCQNKPKQTKPQKTPKLKQKINKQTTKKIQQRKTPIQSNSEILILVLEFGIGTAAPNRSSLSAQAMM